MAQGARGRVRQSETKKACGQPTVEARARVRDGGCRSIAHLADHVPCGWMTTTFLIVRFIHSRLVLWNKHPQVHRVAERKLGFTPTALSNGQKSTPPVVREMGLQIEPVDGCWGSE